MCFRLGASRLPHPAVQQAAILRLQQEIVDLKAQGYELMIADETLFSADSFQHARQWALTTEPMKTTSRFTNLPKIVVCGVISAQRGNVLYRVGVRSFNAQDMEQVLRDIRAVVGPAGRVAIIWDNCRIHRAISVRELAATPEVNIRFLWNLPYRPDLATCGIEFVWRRAKWLYKADVNRYKALNRVWDQEGLVRHVLGQIGDEFASRQALKSEAAMAAARPIQPLATEQTVDRGLPPIIEHSPRQQSYISSEEGADSHASVVAEEGDGTYVKANHV